jgi:hypothetical protein
VLSSLPKSELAFSHLHPRKFGSLHLLELGLLWLVLIVIRKYPV